MKVLIDKSFAKDIDEITDKKFLKSVADCIEVRFIGNFRINESFLSPISGNNSAILKSRRFYKLN